jgi:hypothetical protein
MQLATIAKPDSQADPPNRPSSQQQPYLSEPIADVYSTTEKPQPPQAQFPPKTQSQSQRSGHPKDPSPSRRRRRRRRRRKKGSSQLVKRYWY